MSNKTIFDAVKRSPEKSFAARYMINNAVDNYNSMESRASNAESRANFAEQKLNDYEKRSRSNNKSSDINPLAELTVGILIDSVKHLINDLSGELKGETRVEKTKEVSLRLLKVGAKIGMAAGVVSLTFKVLEANK